VARQSRAPEAPQQETQQAEIVTAPSEPVDATDYKRVYANNVTLTISPVDVRLTFNEAVSDDPKHPFVERRVTVVLSVQTTKALAQLLVDNVRGYESQFGEIRYTPIPQQSGEPST
jgi:Protein of unknown function (DUF3467)